MLSSLAGSVTRTFGIALSCSNLSQFACSALAGKYVASTLHFPFAGTVNRVSTKLLLSLPVRLSLGQRFPVRHHARLETDSSSVGQVRPTLSLSLSGTLW